MKTYVKNIGMTKTIINKDNDIFNAEVKWNGDYDGNIAKLNVDIDNNGKKEQIHMELDNDDLIKLLNTNSVNMPIDERLKNDYLIKSKKSKKSKKSRKYKKSNKNLKKSRKSKKYI
jgi:hypothetical protein